jgi:hypothetical protein
MPNAAPAIVNEAANRKAGPSQAPVREEPAAPAAFNYRCAAELFPTRSRKPRRSSFNYKRFDTAAAAIRFAIEELPGELLLGAYLQVEEERFGSDGIRRLYDSPRYPLKRRAASRK